MQSLKTEENALNTRVSKYCSDSMYTPAAYNNSITIKQDLCAQVIQAKAFVDIAKQLTIMNAKNK